MKPERKGAPRYVFFRKKGVNSTDRGRVSFLPRGALRLRRGTICCRVKGTKKGLGIGEKSAPEGGRARLFYGKKVIEARGKAGNGKKKTTEEEDC